MKEFIDDSGKQVFRKDVMLGCPADDYTHMIVDEASMIDDTIFNE
jgi:predicted phage-related endonuclease